jgi:hypothetical protein
MDSSDPFSSPDRAFERNKIHVFIASSHHQGAYRHKRDVLTNRGTAAIAFVPKRETPDGSMEADDESE